MERSAAVVADMAILHMLAVLLHHTQPAWASRTHSCLPSAVAAVLPLRPPDRQLHLRQYSPVADSTMPYERNRQ